MAAVTRFGPGGTPIASPSVASGVVEAVLDATESADAASFTAQVSITATLNVSPFGSTADSDQITADDTSHTADETGFDNSRGEQADTAAFAAEIGILGIIAGGGAFRRPLVIFPKPQPLPDLPDLLATFAAVEGADRAAFSATVTAGAMLAATDNADTASFAGVSSLSARLTALEDSDVAQFAASLDIEIADDEIMALMLAQAA